MPIEIIERPKALPIDPWVAMSLLQKAIRRGDRPRALTAASTLLYGEGERLRRRLRCIAFEDVGIADCELGSLILAALRGPSESLEWSSIAAITVKLVDAPKCRAADDLLMGADSLPYLAPMWRDLRNAPDDELLSLAVEGGSIYNQAICLRNLLGTERGPERHRFGRHGNPKLAFDALRQMHVSVSIRQMAWEAFRSTGSALGPLAALLSTRLGDAPTEIKHDKIAPAPSFNGVPLWAYDLYCRQGRRALAALLNTNLYAVRWIKRHIPSAEQIEFLGALVFRVEGQRCRNRLRWKLADELRLAMDSDCYGPEATELLGSLEVGLPVLNEVRIRCLSS